MYVCIHVTVYAIYHVSVPSNPKILSLRISLAKSPGDKTWLSDILELYWVSDSLATESYVTGQGFKNLGCFQCNAVKCWVWIFWLWNVMFALCLLEIYCDKSDTTSSPTFATWHYQLHWVHPHYDLVQSLHQPIRPCSKSLIHQKKVDQHEMDFERSRHHQPLRRGDWPWHWLMHQSTGHTWRVSAISHHPFLSWQSGGQRHSFQRQKNITKSAEKTC